MREDRAEHSAEFRRERIVVAGHPFRGYVRSIAAAFTTIGLQSSALEWPNPRSDFLQYLKVSLSRRGRNEAIAKAMTSNSTMLENFLSEYPADYLLVVNGVPLTKGLTSILETRRTKTVLWALDSPVSQPWIADCATGYDLVFTYEPDDIKSFCGFEQAKFLPAAFDSALYHPRESRMIPTTDICFVGSINRSWSERVNALKRVVAEFSDKKIEIWSDTIPAYSPSRFYDFLIVAGKGIRIKRIESSHSEINELYNRTKICLNIHHSQSRRAVNPRSFEVLGSGAFLLTDRPMSDIEGLEAGRDYVLYSGIDDLLAKIEKYLEEERERNRIADSGHNSVMARHTYVHRASRILEDLRSNC